MATYLDDRQRAELAHAARHWVWRTELPTWLLIAVVYSACFGVATHARQLGLPLACVLLTLCTTWYLSLQHELLHGHPTRLPWLNALPESYFLYAADWHAASPATRKLYAVRNTLAGRMLLQPAFSILAVAADAFATLRAGDGRG